MTRFVCDRCNKVATAFLSGELPPGWYLITLRRAAVTERVLLCSDECIVPLLRALADSLENENGLQGEPLLTRN